MDIEVVQYAQNCECCMILCEKVASGVQKPVAYSNVSLIDPVTKAACRVSWRYLADGTKVSHVDGCTFYLDICASLRRAS